MGTVIRSRVLRLAAGVLMASGAVAACSAGVEPKSKQLPPPSASKSAPASDKYLIFPLDSYRETSTEKFTIDAAIAFLVDSCGKRFGFLDLAPNINQEAILASDQEGRSRLYGIRDLTLAKERGYRLARNTAEKRTKRPASDTEYLVKSGLRPGQMPGSTAGGAAKPAEVGGQKVPVGGCYGEARGTIFGGNGTDELTLGSGLAVDAAQSAKADPRVVGLVKKWSACLLTKGIKQSDPYDIAGFDTRDGKPPSQREIQTATADVECKLDTGMIPAWHAVWVEYEQKLLEKNQLALTEERAKRAKVIAKASQVIQ